MTLTPLVNNTIIAEGLAVARFYYEAQRYFSSLILSVEAVANLLADQGYKVPNLNFSRPVAVAYYSWSSERGAHLPKGYMMWFDRGTSSTGQIMDQYGFSLWFFTSNPEGGQPWVPTGFFYRVTPKQEGELRGWSMVQKIAEEIRLKVVNPQAEATFLQYAEPWPPALAGQGVGDRLQSMSVVPFPLTSIKTTEDLEAITIQAVKALSEENPDIIRKDPVYLKRVWAL
jgi:hypothetical protein